MAERDEDFGTDIGKSSANAGSDDPEILEEHQDQAEQGAAQGGRGRIQ